MLRRFTFTTDQTNHKKRDGRDGVRDERPLAGLGPLPRWASECDSAEHNGRPACARSDTIGRHGGTDRIARLAP